MRKPPRLRMPLRFQRSFLTPPEPGITFPGTLEQWEQGRRKPSQAAKTLIKVAELHPEVLRKVAP